MKETEEEQEVITLKKIPSVPTKAEEIRLLKATKTTVVDVEMVHRRTSIDLPASTQKTSLEREPREKTATQTEAELPKPKEVKEIDSAKDSLWSHQKDSPKDKKPEDKIHLKKTPKLAKAEEPAPASLAIKKVKRLPSDEAEQETVKLKPFDRPSKPTEEPVTDKKERPEREAVPFEKKERLRPEDETQIPTKKEEIFGKTEEPQAKVQKQADRKKTPEEEKDAAKVPLKGKRIPPKEQETEGVKLKPFSRPAKDAKEPAAEEKPGGEKLSICASRDQLPREAETEPHLKKTEMAKRPEKVTPKGHEEMPEKVVEAAPTTVEKIVSPKPTADKAVSPKPTADKTLSPKPTADKAVSPKPTTDKAVSPKPIADKTPGKTLDEATPLQLKKGVTPKEKEEYAEPVLKPVDQLKKVELKKTPSPKVDKPKPKELESLPIEKKPSVEKVKRIPKTVSPKDSVEAVALKKVPKKPSPEEEKAGEAVKPSKGKVPVVKEVSPRAVQLRKVPTQLEEEVFEEDYEVEPEEGEEEEEAWGWELVPSESYTSEDWPAEGEDAVEAPGVTRRGEVVTSPDHLVTTDNLLLIASITSTHYLINAYICICRHHHLLCLIECTPSCHC